MNKRISQLLRLFLIISIISVFFVASASSSDVGRDYDIPFVEKIIQIHDDGLINITEDFNYTFRGTYNGVYRDLPISGNQSVSNISVETPGLYNDFTVTNTSGNVRITVRLYKDAQKTQGVSNQSANIIYHYSYHKALKMYNDVAEFQYMSWGSEWEKDVTRMTTYIKLPGTKYGVEKWDNPSYYVTSDSWITPNTLETRFRTIESGKTVEQRLLIPKSQFNSTDNADVINQDAIAIIKQDQQEYQDLINNNYNVTYIATILSIILLLTPVGIYYKYGREPKFSQELEYSLDIPTNDSPVFINAVVNGDVDDINSDAFYATILDLIDKKYFKIISAQKDAIIRITDKDSTNLEKYEREIIKYFSKFEDDDGHISFTRIKKTEDPLKFQKFLKHWNYSAKESLDDNKIDRFFHDKGSILFKIYAPITLIYAIVMLIWVFSLEPAVPTIDWAFRATIILIPVAILTIILPNTVAGQWTIEGKKFHDEWKNFEKYVTDYSLIKQYPPESVQVWSKYLVYATALGCAKTVTVNMKTYFKQMNMSDDEILESDAVLFTYIGTFAFMSNTFHNFETYTPPSEGGNAGSGGSFGNIGGPGMGGFGGGGGGAF